MQICRHPLADNESQEANGSEEQGNRRRGRRGGRGRGERRPEAETVTPVVETGEATAPVQETAEPVSQEPVIVVIPAAEPIAVEAIAPTIESSPVAVEPVAVAPVAFVETKQAEPEAASVETAVVEAIAISAPQIEETVIQPVAVVPEPIDLTSALAESGLVLVQTTAPAVAIAPTEPPVKLGRPRKQKSVTEQAENEPLVMVETGK